MTSSRAILTVIACAGAFASSADAAILRVVATALPGGDGSSWSRAFDSLTDALSAASSGDFVWVAGGDYNPELPAGRDATFQIPNGVQVYGGFDGDESFLGQRGDPLNPPTTLNGTVAGGAAYSVVTFTGAGSNTVLDGFFIVRGVADGPGPGPDRNGGAIYADDSSPTLRNLTIDQCAADSNGGAIYLGGATANFTNISDCVFLDNTSGNSGGAISAAVPVTIQRCEFNGNQANSGGALRLVGNGVHTVADSEFVSNDASGATGGAIIIAMNAGSSFSTISGCEFRSNTAPIGGALDYTLAGDHTVRSCRFFSNGSTSLGAGAIDFASSDATISLLVENSLFTGNTANTGAGGIRNDSKGDMHIVNCTIAENTCDGIGGGGVSPVDGTTTIDNSIIWENIAPGASGQDVSIFTVPLTILTVNRSIVQFLGVGDPVPSGVGSINANPKFVDLNGPDNTTGTPDDNARLMSGSPAIDRGNNLVLSPFVFSDIYADPRFIDDASTPDTGVPDGVNPIVDLGASEFPGEDPTSCNAADMAEPFGVLDFTDIVAFLSAFGAMDPAADLAAPFGVFDFSDVITFLGAFGAGCP